MPKTWVWGAPPAPAPSPTGEELKEAGIEQALKDQELFVNCVMNLVLKNMRGMLVTGEDIRLAFQDKCPVPRHPHAWGGAVSALATKHKVLEDTGLTRKAKDPRSHARRLVIWRVK